ncbi:GtrA family protein [Priestia aryabhattai]|uniref:GtrA family protein n=1 Tax=Priestia aryabhattai TaxID=412384 RepID=UPI001C0C20C0|nr:GtrA family protein [Priestia aryabhattai]MBU3572980.1 GtrA family protein [Priestia aryabhattai]WDL85947.1 GtrA family protein [Priestia aryabhattai]
MKGSFIRFLVVGLVNTAVGLSIMYVLLHIFHHYWIATFVGNAAGAGVSYVLNRIFTFKSGVHLSKSILRFILVIGICYGLSYYIGLQFSSWLLHQLPPAVRPFKTDVGILIGTGLYTLLNYTGQKYFVFNAKKEAVVIHD